MKITIKTLLMIRAQDQAVEFVAELSLPNPVIYAPMVRIDALKPDTTAPNADIIIFTSSNAVRQYAARSDNLKAQVLCVGSITTRAAIAMGFKVSSTFETASALVAHIQKTQSPGVTVLYPRAETISLDIKNALFDMKIPVHDLVLYRQTFLPLSDVAKSAIESSALITPILSKEIAKQFRAALVFLKPQNLTLLCISAPVAAVFDDLSGFRVEIAQTPTRAALIADVKTRLSA